MIEHIIASSYLAVPATERSCFGWRGVLVRRSKAQSRAPERAPAAMKDRGL
jgi:hypothetical protein